MARISVYTDGSARGNPGPGGFGVVLMSGERKKEISEGFRHTTNNRMELLSVIVALESLNGSGHEVLIYSDSKYVVDAVEKKWVFGWQKKGFKGKKNEDLWQRFLRIYPKHNVKIQMGKRPRWQRVQRTLRYLGRGCRTWHQAEAGHFL